MNNLNELNDILFDCLREVKSARDTSQLKMALNKSNGVTKISNSIVQNARLAMEAKKMEMGSENVAMPKMLENSNGK